MNFPLEVREPRHGNPAAICDRMGRIIALCPPYRNAWLWCDGEAKQLVEAANASQSHP